MSHHDHQHAHHQDGAHGEHAEHHVVSYSQYIQVWLTLMFFTCLTVLASFVHAGSLNMVIALLIATIKAGLVLAIFMHVKYDSKTVKGFLVTTGLTLAFIAILTIIDIANRPEMLH